MATANWFNYDFYMNNKLTQMVASDPAGGWTLTKLVQTFGAAGFVGPEGAQAHFEAFGQNEGLSPNSFFSPQEYYAAKAAEFYKKTPSAVTELDTANIELAIKQAGMNAWSHYTAFGSAEGVNPSNNFDSSKYMDAKLAAMKTAEPDGAWDMPKLVKAFQDAGLSALEHFMMFGGAGSGEVAQKYDPAKPSIPAEFAVPESDKVTVNDGKTFTLTTDVDNIVGTSGNDTIFAGTQASDATLTNGDQIDGGDGTDTLKIYAGITNFPTVSLKGVEIVEDYSGADVINVSGNADIKEVWLNKASTNAATAATTQIIGFGDVAGNVAAVATFNAAGGSADAATIALKDAGKAATYTSIEVNNIEALTIDAAGKNQIGNLIAATAETITIKGSGSVKAVLAPGSTVLKSVDASANTGGVDLTLTDAQFGSNAIMVTGGTGGDKIAFTDALGAKATIDLGNGNNSLTITQGTTGLTAGSTFKAGTGSDTLVLAATTTAITATTGKMFTGFENIKLSGASSYTVGHIAGITGYEIASNNNSAATISALANATTVKISASSTGTQTLTLADNSDATSSVTVSLDNSAAVTAANGAAQAGIATVIDTNAHVLNFASVGTVSTGSVNKVDLTGATNSLAQITNIKITGDQAAELTTAAATALTLIDGSSATGDLTITATDATKSMTIKGGEGKDTIVATDVANALSTITGGKGADTITLGATDANNKGDVLMITGQADSTAAGFDIVTNFTGGTTTSANADVINLKAFGFTGGQADIFTLGAGAVTVANSGAGATFTISDANAKDFFANAGTDKAVALHSTDNQTFVFIDADKNGDWNADTDSVILLVGNYNTGSGDVLIAGQFTFA